MGAGAIGLKAVFSAEDRGVSATVARLTGAVRGLTSAGQGLGKIDAFNSRIAGGIKTAAVGLGAIGVGAGFAAKNVIDAGADFEQAITNVGAVSLMTRGQIAPLEELAKKLGATTKFSATEVANAMEEMGKAGFENSEILAGVGGILAAAAADGGELAETAENVSSVMKGMGLATSEAARVADVLALAGVRTKSSINTLAESMANVSSTARQLGVPLEDTVAMVAMLQDVGLDASEAGSALNTMLTQMSAPSKEAAAQMAAMGIKFDDAAGNMLAPTKVLEQLVKAGTKAGGNMKQVAFFADLVGLRGQKAAVNLKELFKEGKVAGLTKELYAAEGVAKKIADIKMDTFRGDIETLGGSIDSLKIKLFDLQGGPLRGVVQGTTDWLETNNELITSGLNDFIKESIPILDNFKDGLLSAGESALPFIKGVGGVLSKLFGNDSKNARMEAFLWGEDLGKWTIAWVGLSVGIKVARVATFAFTNAAEIARGTMIAWNATMAFFKGTLYAYQVATGVGAANTIAFSGAMNGAKASAIGMTAATTAAGNSFTAMAGRAGLAGIALGSLFLAWDQLDKFQKENGGWEGVSGFLGLDGGRGGFDGVDDVMNRQAREEAIRDGSYVPVMPADPRAAATPKEAAVFGVLDKYGMPPEQRAGGGYAAAFGLPPAPGMAPPPPAAAVAAGPRVPSKEEFSAMVQQELTVKLVAEPGTSAEVVKKPAGAKVNLEPSGSFY